MNEKLDYMRRVWKNIPRKDWDKVCLVCHHICPGCRCYFYGVKGCKKCKCKNTESFRRRLLKLKPDIARVIK
jgi:hypothetical protein